MTEGLVVLELTIDQPDVAVAVTFDNPLGRLSTTVIDVPAGAGSEPAVLMTVGENVIEVPVG